MQEKNNYILVDIKIKNLNEFQELLQQLHEVIEKIEAFKPEVEIIQPLRKDLERNKNE